MVVYGASTQCQKKEIRMPPRTTTWTLEPHTKGKHMVLQHYMGAWLPILTSWNGRVLFVDAFAGPGEYSGGEPGSPVIALRALINHRALRQIRSEVNPHFPYQPCRACRNQQRNYPM
jgi:three-Cys-motif partner protein